MALDRIGVSGSGNDGLIKNLAAEVKPSADGLKSKVPVITDKSQICQSPTTKKVYNELNSKVFGAKSIGVRSNVSMGEVSSSYSTKQTGTVDDLASRTIGSMRPTSRGISKQDKMHIIATVSSGVSESTKNWDQSDFKELAGLKEKLSGIVESLIGEHSESIQARSGKGFSNVEKRVMKDEVLFNIANVIFAPVFRECASEYVKIEGDISHLEASMLHIVHDLGGARFGKVQKTDLAEKSFEQLGMAVGQLKSTADPKEIAGILESKGCGKTLTAEDKSRIIESVCEELVLLGVGPSKAEKENRFDRSHIGKDTHGIKETALREARASHGNQAEKKVDSKKGTAGEFAQVELNQVAQKADQKAKRENQQRLDEKFRNKLKEIDQ